MPTGPDIILTLKVLVTTVTILFVAAVWAIATGRKKLHGRINTVFFVLTLLTVLVFELLIRFGLDMTSTFTESARQALTIHLGFAIPAALVLPVMFWSGWTGRKRLHLPLSVLFVILWTGTFITGLFFLPHDG